MTSNAVTIALLTHASGDLTVLAAARAQLPDGFASVQAVDLQQCATSAQMMSLLEHDLAGCRLILVRVLGRLGSVPGLTELVNEVRRQVRHRLVQHFR